MADVIVDVDGHDFGFDVDSLVDDTLLNTYIFSDPFDEKDTVSCLQVGEPNLTSPFHESDSGMSDGSLWSPMREEPIMLDELLENLGSDTILLNNTMNSQFVDSLCGDESSGRPNVTSITKTATTTSPSSSRQTRSKSGVLKTTSYQAATTRVSNDHFTTSTSRATPNISSFLPTDSDSDAEVDVMGSSPSKTKGSVLVHHRGSTLPSRSKSSDSDASSSNVTSVKIVRVKGSGIDSADGLAKALEERNRKNAELAKMNRQKKKVYVEGLEKEVEDGKQREVQLEATVKSLVEEKDELKREVEYLKCVLANQSSLAGLLKNIPSVSGVSLSSSIMRKRAAEVDHSYTPRKIHRTELSTSTAGVCLHVDQDKVSLEFCHHCAQMAHCSDGE